MNDTSKLYSIKNKNVQKSVNLDDSLYENLKHLTAKKYDASISELVNVCIENYIERGAFSFYEKPKLESVTYRTIMIRKNNIEALQKIHKKTGMSITRLINSAIKEFIDNE